MRHHLPPLVLIAMLLAIASCAPGPSLSSRYGLPPCEPSGTPLSNMVVLVADNQLHHLYGDAFFERSQFADRLIPTAIRSVQLDLFAPSLLRWVVNRYGQRSPMIHLGDAMDLSCSDEFERFAAIMADAKKPWFLAPGNHDGFYFGTTYPAGETTNWTKACKRGKNPLPKPALITAYVDALKASADPGARELGAAFPTLAEREWGYTGTDRAMLQRVAWRVASDDEGYTSYILQEVELTQPNSERRVFAYLLDTSDYKKRPKLIPIDGLNAGMTGELSVEQVATLDHWLETRPGAVKVLMGHHPFHTLTAKTRKRLDALRTDHDVLMYVSAHTHVGNYYVRGSDEETWLELNVGSTTDSPLEFRNFRVSSYDQTTEECAASREEIPGRVFVHSQRYRLGTDTWKECGSHPEWRAKPEDPDFYARYATQSTLSPTKTRNRLMLALLHTHLRLLREVPTDTGKAALWPFSCNDDACVTDRTKALVTAGTGGDALAEAAQALARFDTGRTAEDPARHQAYRRCQAIWASLDDEVGARVPRVDDAYIVFPPNRDAPVAPDERDPNAVLR